MKRFLLSGAILFAFVTNLGAQNVDEILTKYYDALGGLDKLKAVNTIIQEGVFAAPMGNAELQVTIKKKRPNKWISEMSFQGQKIVQAYDGDVAWMQNPMMGMVKPTALSGDQAKQVIQQAQFDGELVNYKDKGVVLEFVGMAEFEGMNSYKLQATRPDSQQVLFYIDKDTNLLMGTEVPVKTPEQQMTITVKLGDYEEIDGLYYPHSLEVLGAQKMSFVFDDIELNSDIPDDVFTMPTEEN